MESAWETAPERVQAWGPAQVPDPAVEDWAKGKVNSRYGFRFARLAENLSSFETRREETEAPARSLRIF